MLHAGEVEGINAIEFYHENETMIRENERMIRASKSRRVQAKRADQRTAGKGETCCSTNAFLRRVKLI